jgi:acylphosphatase
MIARKIIYHGNFNQNILGSFFDITRKNEINGLVKKISDQRIELELEGDAAQIKLVQHQIDRKFKSMIKVKEVHPNCFKHFEGLSLDF